jgi:hypothetical protein
VTPGEGEVIGSAGSSGIKESKIEREEEREKEREREGRRR